MTETPYELILNHSREWPGGWVLPSEREMDLAYPAVYFHPDEYTRAAVWLGKRCKFQTAAPSASVVWSDKAKEDALAWAGIGPAGLEATVKMMKGPEAIALARANGADLKEPAPNGGVLVMRAKNALYVMIRKGELKHIK